METTQTTEGKCSCPCHKIVGLFIALIGLTFLLVCGVMLPGLATTCPRSTSSRFVPLSSSPTLSPACP